MSTSPLLVKVLLIFFLVILLFLFILIVDKNNQTLENKEDFGQLFIEPLEISLTHSYYANGKSIPDIELTDINGKINSMFHLMNKRKSIIILYSEVTCNVCTDSLFDRCNLLKSENADFNFYAIAYSKDINFLRRFARINKIKFPILKDINNDFANKLDISALPAVLLVDENGIIRNSFFINPNIKILNDVFFDYLKNLNH